MSTTGHADTAAAPRVLQVIVTFCEQFTALPSPGSTVKGSTVGAEDGSSVGAEEGPNVGVDVGMSDGSNDGSAVGSLDGEEDGSDVGLLVGDKDGPSDGTFDGGSDGRAVGTGLGSLPAVSSANITSVTTLQTINGTILSFIMRQFEALRNSQRLLCTTITLRRAFSSKGPAALVPRLLSSQMISKSKIAGDWTIAPSPRNFLFCQNIQ